MSEYAIEVNNLCINYKGMKAFSIKQSLLKGKKNRVKVVEAVKNISFKVPKGEIMGIIGKNGSGKSTMLRAIAGIFSPNSGTIDLHGNSVSLAAKGRMTSFDYENPYLNIQKLTNEHFANLNQ